MSDTLPPLPRRVTAVLVMQSDLMQGEDLEADVQDWGKQCAAAARLAEREACALLCDERADSHKYGSLWDSRSGLEADRCAAAIRARKD